MMNNGRNGGFRRVSLQRVKLFSEVEHAFDVKRDVRLVLSVISH